jgi:hypothetical protein
VHGRNLVTNVTYVTLSHRWGAAALPLLTTSNLHQLEHEVSTAVLSPTYLEAFDVARRLRIRYIWIDSLCIIQQGDGLQDWREEALKMDQVYKNGFLNISADWGSATVGLFWDRDTTYFHETRLAFRQPSTDQKMIFQSADARLWARELRLSPLNRRAWVFQERLLSARVLHFCRGEIFWECCEKAACETYPTGLPGETNDMPSTTKSIKQFAPSTNRNTTRPFLESRLGRSFDAKETAFLVWWEIADTYTTLGLTQTSDKLVALAGLARHLRESLDGFYVAGLWSHYLLESLCWRVVWRSGDTRPIRYRGPSFSWISVDSIVLGPQHGLLFADAAVASATCVKFRETLPWDLEEASLGDEEITEDVFGPLYRPSVELRLTGTLKSAKLERRDGHWWMIPLGSASQFDGKGVTEGKIKVLLDYQPTEEAEINSVSQTTFYYMPLIDLIGDPRRAEYEERHGPDTYGWVSFVCILLRVEDASMGRFRRIGCYHSFVFEYSKRAARKEDQQFEIARELALSSKERAPDALPCWRYDGEAGLHTIYVV